MTNSFVRLAIVVTLNPSQDCYAEPVPLPPEKMWEYSDAIVVVDVVSLTNTGQKGLQNKPVYSVHLAVREVRKGSLPVGHIMVWTMSDYQPPPGGYGGGVFYPGDRLLLYLERFPNGAHRTWGHNCIEAVFEVPVAQRHFPTIAGESLIASSPLAVRCPVSRHSSFAPACQRKDRNTIGNLPICKRILWRAQ